MDASRKVQLVRLAPDAPSADIAEDTRAASDVFPTEHKKLKLVDEAVADAALGVLVSLVGCE